MKVLYEDNHIIVINKASSEIVQGDRTGDKPLSEKVKEYFGLKLSDATMNLKENRRKSLILLLVSFLTWSLLSLFNYFNIAEIFMEAYLVIIWFFLWTFAEFEFIDRPKLKYDKLDMAQLASMKIVFKHE